MLRLHETRNSRIQGNIGLTTAMLWFERNGYSVYLPLTDSQDADLGADIEGRIRKVQVKTTYHKTEHGIYKVTLRVSGGNRSGIGKVKFFDPNAVDYLFVVTEADDKYLIPSSAIKCLATLNLGVKYEPFRVF